MPFRTAVLSLLSLLVFAIPSPVAAKTIDIPVYWSIQKGELSIARLRLYLGPKIRKEMCAKNGAALRAGNTIRVIIYGAGKELITTFTYTKRDCQ